MGSMNCPGCGKAMETKVEADLTSDNCNYCGGTFLDKGELNDLAVGMEGDVEFCSIDNESHEDKFPNRMCPKCDKQAMRKINLLRLSDIIFDYCPECDGLFLDKNEIELMNNELRILSGDGIDSEIRKHINGNLLRVDKIVGATLIANPKTAGELSATETTTFRVSLYYKKSLEMGLRVTKEPWTIRFLKFFGLFDAQDIEIGSSKFDNAFIIQGHDIAGIKNLLSAQELQKDLLEFISTKPKIHLVPGTLEVLDSCLVYTEGPYTGQFTVDIHECSKEIVEKLQNISLRIETSA